MIEIFVTEDDYRFKIEDMYWFEENGVHDITSGEGHYFAHYHFEIFINGELIWQSEKINQQDKQG